VKIGRFPSGCMAWLIAYLVACYAWWLIVWLGSAIFYGDSSFPIGSQKYAGTPAPPPPPPIDTSTYVALVITFSPVTVPFFLLLSLLAIPLGLILPEFRMEPGSLWLFWVSFGLPFITVGLAISAIMHRRRGGPSEPAQSPITGAEAPPKKPDDQRRS